MQLRLSIGSDNSGESYIIRQRGRLGHLARCRRGFLPLSVHLLSSVVDEKIRCGRVYALAAGQVQGVSAYASTTTSSITRRRVFSFDKTRKMGRPCFCTEDGPVVEDQYTSLSLSVNYARQIHLGFRSW